MACEVSLKASDIVCEVMRGLKCCRRYASRVWGIGTEELIPLARGLELGPAVCDWTDEVAIRAP
jgi:hypothetical protein